MRSIAVITGSRSDYGIIRSVLRAIDKHPNLRLFLIVTGMHLSKEFGDTLQEIKKDGFKISARINMLSSWDLPFAMANSLGRCILGIAKVLDKIKPQIMLIIGDRIEMLSSAVSAAYMNIPIAHIHGGDVSGSIDDSARHAITKLSHIHFPATKKSAQRLIKIGEEPWRVNVVGAPALDSIFNERLIEPEEIAKKYNLDLSKLIILMIQHPVTSEYDRAAVEIKQTLDAIVDLRCQTILIYPNADAGGRRMIKVIKKYEKYPFIRIFKSISHREYLSLMRIANVMVGNSSSGIIEAPSFHLPVVNIGARQQGRERADNVIDVGYSKKEIILAVKKALFNKEFKESVKRCKSPYGDGNAARRIINILTRINIDNKLLQKSPTY